MQAMSATSRPAPTAMDHVGPPEGLDLSFFQNYINSESWIEPSRSISNVRLVLQALSDAGLPLDVDKSAFMVRRVDYLVLIITPKGIMGLIITPKGIKMDSRKLSAIAEWPVTSTAKDLHGLVGFAEDNISWG
ncbi:Ribosomal RNA-processing protein 7 [Ascosphaera pollenicola]|nr:Ribosomal RNA-processing protein 7 [Ascosphaera pollenicola]